MEKEKEKLSLTDVTKLIGDVFEAKFAEKAEKEAKEVIEAKVKEETEKIDIKVITPTVEEIQKEADKAEWESMGEYLMKVWLYRGGFDRFPDNRLVYMNAKGQPSEPVEYKGLDKAETEKAILKTMTEGTDSAGGFLVPQIYEKVIYALKLENSVIRPNGPQIYPMTTDTLNIPRIDDTAHTSHVYGGVAGKWTEEAGTKTETEPSFGSCKLTAHEFSAYTRASNNLLADTPVALEGFIKKWVSEALAYYEDDAFINGNGVGMPLGILNSGALIQHTRTDTNNVVWGDIPNMWGRLFAESRNRAIWLMNQECEKDVLKAVAENVTAAATAGSLVTVSIDQGAVKTPPRVLFGRPYFVTEKMAALGSANDIGLFDLSYYIIGDRSPLAIDTSGHVGFTSNVTYWRFTLRVDGQPWLASPLTPKNGTDTIGPFVTLSSTS